VTTVILAEKPSQARSYMEGLKIKHTAKQHKASGTTFLDEHTVIVAAAGHLLELCEPEHYNERFKDRDNIDDLPIIPEHFDYMLRADVKSLYVEIKKELAEADVIIIATDKDNEGGAIAYNILRFSRNLHGKRILRAYPTALNKEAVVRQFKTLDPIDKTWKDANAAIARARSDWMIGMNLSRLYTAKLKNVGIIGNYAVGRSISTTLNLICQWELERQNFKEEAIFELDGEIKINDEVVTLKSPIREVGKGSKTKFIKKLQTSGITKKQVIGTVVFIDSKIKQVYPSIMFTKGNLYKEMARVAGWSQEKSKEIMQINYEMGYQTYPRTDAGEIPRYQYEYLKNNFDKYMNAIGEFGNYVKFQMTEDKLKRYLTKENSDDAHYGIVPTEKLMTAMDQVTDDQRLMYEVVVRKAMTLLLKPYTYTANRLGIDINGIPMIAQNNVVTDRGWKGILLPTKSRIKRKMQTEKVM